MELGLYGRIIYRRLWLIVGLLVILLASYLPSAHRAPAPYVASMRYVVGVQPEASRGNYYTYDRYYTWLTAEYMLDDLSEVVKSRSFADDVASLAGINVPAGAIQGSTAAGKLHRILTVSVTWGNQGELERIAGALSEVLRTRSARYFAQLSTDSAVISEIDPPSISQAGISLRQKLDLPLRLVLALILGIALAFLWDYLDDTVRHRADMERLGLPILAEIPAPRGLRAPFRRQRSIR
jgi:capsular polysaccharide biosynthesis protein